MFTHVMLGANDVAASKTFYDATLGALGHGAGVMDDKGRCVYQTATGIFILTAPIDGEPATHANGGTLGFFAANSESADAWHAAGVANGGVACEDPPGIRAGARDLYVAYLRDPSGNKICAVHPVG